MIYNGFSNKNTITLIKEKAKNKNLQVKLVDNSLTSSDDYNDHVYDKPCTVILLTKDLALKF